MLIALLNAVLRPPVPIESVVVVGEEPEVLSVEGKQVALDLRLRLANGEEVDIEVQTRGHAALRERSLYYW
jgi:predicted transposase/invertase (TIGR01784 family)